MRTPPSSWASFAGTSGGSTTQAVVVTESTGDCILVFAFTTSATVTVSGVSDGTSNTFAKLFSHAQASVGTCEIWAALNSSASGSKTVTVTWGATATFNSVCALDIPGLVTSSLLDNDAFLSTTSSQLAGPSITMANPGELGVYGFMGTSVLLTPTVSNVTPGGSIFVFSSSALHAINFGVIIFEQSGTTTVNPTWNQTSSGLFHTVGALLKQQAATTFIEDPSEVPDETNTINYATQVITATALSPAMPYPVTVGQTFPPPYGGQFPES